ncbi:MAG: D-sedoheptulose 7-phosphate isomerase [Desulfobulbaceae bacterium]|nr:D-sedoheptulose 7-phosphate isomerase [Desulfobulbaceae bacterium]HIJ77797.1 D-sedoheptulose 7-phosphate isomerase [Deltaproteobacteria bacterium]
MDKLIAESLKNSIEAKQALYSSQLQDIKVLAQWMIDTIKSGNKLMFFGNGGSAADAQHLAAEFVNRFLIDRPPLAAIALTTDTSILTSVGNDFSYDDIFAKQIRALGKKGDLVLGISTSGNSPNVLAAIEVARQMGIKTAALTGGSGGKLKDTAELTLNVPSKMTPAIQEAHIWVEHLLCQIVDEALYGKGVTP